MTVKDKKDSSSTSNAKYIKTGMIAKPKNDKKNTTSPDTCKRVVLPSSAPSQEFIGKNAQIIKSSNPQLVGLHGVVINETKSMFYLLTKKEGTLKEKRTKMIPKNNSVWRFYSKNEVYTHNNKPMNDKHMLDRTTIRNDDGETDRFCDPVNDNTRNDTSKSFTRGVILETVVDGRIIEKRSWDRLSIK